MVNRNNVHLHCVILSEAKNLNFFVSHDALPHKILRFAPHALNRLAFHAVTALKRDAHHAVPASYHYVFHAGFPTLHSGHSFRFATVIPYASLRLG